MPIDESSPLLQFPGGYGSVNSTNGDFHDQFCHLTGTPPLNVPVATRARPHPDSLYARVKSHHRHQNAIYLFTATLINTLLLTQVVLGATLTGLGASDSSRILITVFGALNTVIAGLIAFLKSRGQPVRSRMFRDDLERVIYEIENSAVMWLGISRDAHGYAAIDTDQEVTVRSEIARLTRLYDKAVKTNTMNDPEMYATGFGSDFHVAALKGLKPVTPAIPIPASTETSNTAKVPETPAVIPPTPTDPDESPATKADTKPASKASDQSSSEPGEGQRSAGEAETDKENVSPDQHIDVVSGAASEDEDKHTSEIARDTDTEMPA